MNSRVCVLGSINMDILVAVNRFPNDGETVEGTSFKLSPGGKGANQAVAAANMGASTDLIGALGDDDFGRVLRDHLAMTGVNIGSVSQVHSSSGVAVVLVDGNGNNQIIVTLGSNMLLSKKTVNEYFDERCTDVKYLIAQFESPIEIVSHSFTKAKLSGITTVLNPSPMQSIPYEIMENTDIFVLNEVELAQASGHIGSISSHDEAVQILQSWIPEIARNKTFIVTLGKNGLIGVHENRVIRRLAPKIIQVVDTTGAGDCFCGSMVAFLNRGYSFIESIDLAQEAAAYCVQRRGTSTSFPKLESLNITKMKG